MIEQFYLTSPRWDPNRFNHLCPSGPGNNDNERYSTFPKTPILESHHQIKFSVTHKRLVGSGGVLFFLRGSVGIFYRLQPHQPKRHYIFFSEVNKTEIAYHL